MKEQNKIIALASIMLFLGNICFAQDFYMYCGKEKLPYEYGNKDHFSMVVHCPYIEYRTNKAMPRFINVKNLQYLQNRVGKQFFETRVKLDACYIIDFNNKKLVQHKDWLEKADKRVKYAFQYSFLIQGRNKYYFTIVYDSVGNMISPDMIPDHHANNAFSKIIPICKAKDIIESKMAEKLTNISLQYTDSINSFVWRGEFAPKKQADTQIETQTIFIVNANNGLFFKREEKTIYSNCNGNTPPMPKLK